MYTVGEGGPGDFRERDILRVYVSRLGSKSYINFTYSIMN
jgi:hypothetical protein